MCQKEPHIQCCQVEVVEELGEHWIPICRNNGNVLYYGAYQHGMIQQGGKVERVVI